MDESNTTSTADTIAALSDERALRNGVDPVRISELTESAFETFYRMQLERGLQTSSSSLEVHHMKVALITGANKGLGYATARQLGQSGVNVIIGARDGAKGEQAARELRDQQIDAEALTLDVTDESSVKAAAQHLAERHERLDILINNAGILPEVTAADEVAGPLDLRMFKSTFETNVFGAVSIMQEFLPLLANSEAGRIVNVSTTMGSLTDQSDPESPYYGLAVPAYRASKAALNSITIGLSKALADTNVKVNSICPGWVQTDLGGPENRAQAPLTADEAARIVVDMALIPQDGPSGQFVDRDGTVAW